MCSVLPSLGLAHWQEHELPESLGRTAGRDVRKQSRQRPQGFPGDCSPSVPVKLSGSYN